MKIKTILTLFLLTLIYGKQFAQTFTPESEDDGVKVPSSKLLISGIGDGPLFNGTPKFLELYVVEDVPDLSSYGLETIHNGKGTTGIEFTFPPIAASAGSYLYVTTDAVRFRHWFNFPPDYLVFSINFNGNDAVALYEHHTIVDVFGAAEEDGTGSAWEYTDGFAYRMKNKTNTPKFNSNDWLFSGAGAWNGESDNASAVIPFPDGTFNTKTNKRKRNNSAPKNHALSTTKGNLSVGISLESCIDHCCGERLGDGL